MFSTVVRCRYLRDGNRDVAIKLIRNNDLMEKAGLKEMVCYDNDGRYFNLLPLPF